MGSRQLDFIKSFQISIQPVLTTVSKEDVHGAFSMYSNDEKERSYRLFIQVSKALHQNLAEVEKRKKKRCLFQVLYLHTTMLIVKIKNREQFESKCHESEVLTTFDKIEHLVEEQSLDTLHADESNINDIKEKVSALKMDEIQYLQSLLQKVEEQNSKMETQIQSLKRSLDQTNALNAVEKLKSWNSFA